MHLMIETGFRGEISDFTNNMLSPYCRKLRETLTKIEKLIKKLYNKSKYVLHYKINTIILLKTRFKTD